ncbi:unnamed protein product [Lecanosticta acicola]|uniref:Unnamed protein product n=1 Tax=Lecanosticta acicola TaxID=111012 RepID=A0AAI9E8N9_9PEZI|nr:unnamed protein product [Lecanosticta acicola]
MAHQPFYHDNLGTGLRIAQLVGLTSTAFFAGKEFTKSISTVPALAQSPAPLLAKQWKIQFDADKALAPAVALFSSGVFGFLAYRDNAWTKTSILYATSSTLLAALIPYTFVLAEPLNKKLESKERNLASASITDASAEAGVSKEESTHSLVENWAAQSFGRFVISAIAAVAATWAAIDRAEVVPATARLATGANRI